MAEKGQIKKVKVALRVNLKNGPGGQILRKGTVFYDRLINLPSRVKEAVKAKNTKVIQFLDEDSGPITFNEPEVTNAERNEIKPLDVYKKREEIKSHDPRGVSHVADAIITPPTKPVVKESQLKKQGE